MLLAQLRIHGNERGKMTRFGGWGVMVSGVYYTMFRTKCCEDQELCQKSVAFLLKHWPARSGVLGHVTCKAYVYIHHCGNVSYQSCFYWEEHFICTGFPLGLENLEKWEGIFQLGKSQGILTRLGKSGKITQNTGKLREFHTNVICYILVTVKWICVLFAKFDEVLSSKKTRGKKYWKNGKRYWKSHGEKWETCCNRFLWFFYEL